MLSLLIWPKVITLSGFYCSTIVNQIWNHQDLILLVRYSIDSPCLEEDFSLSYFWKFCSWSRNHSTLLLRKRKREGNKKRRGKERVKERERGGNQRGRERNIEKKGVCVCVCMREREREGEGGEQMIRKVFVWKSFLQDHKVRLKSSTLFHWFSCKIYLFSVSFSKLL